MLSLAAIIILATAEDETSAQVRLASRALFPEATADNKAAVAEHAAFSAHGALNVLTKAAEQTSNGDALLLLSVLESTGMRSALDGRSPPGHPPVVNKGSADALLRRAATQGSVEARFSLAVAASSDPRKCEEAANLFQSVISSTLPKDHEHQNFVPAVRLSEVWEDQSHTPLALGEGALEIEYIRQKAAEGDRDSAFHMGMISLHGDRLGGVEKNFSAAVVYLQQALSLGADAAHVQLCMALLNGYGTEQNVERGRTHCLEAIRKGQLEAHNTIAVMYLRGQWFADREDYEKSGLNLTATAAEGQGEGEGEGEGQGQGQGEDRGGGGGEGGGGGGVYEQLVGAYGDEAPSQEQVNKQLAFQHLKRAAEAGVQSAFRNLGVAYLNGLGTERNMSEVERWYRRGAERGELTTSYYLGLVYLNLTSGQWQMNAEQQQKVPRNCSKALPWLKEVALRSLEHSHTRDSVMGRSGVELAYTLYKKGDLSAAFRQYAAMGAIGSTDALVNAAFLLEREQQREEQQRRLGPGIDMGQPQGQGHRQRLGMVEALKVGTEAETELDNGLASSDDGARTGAGSASVAVDANGNVAADAASGATSHEPSDPVMHAARQRLFRFYQRHNPTKVRTPKDLQAIDATLQRYRGRHQATEIERGVERGTEEEAAAFEPLWEELWRKYNVSGCHSTNSSEAASAGDAGATAGAKVQSGVECVPPLTRAELAAVPALQGYTHTSADTSASAGPSSIASSSTAATTFVLHVARPCVLMPLLGGEPPFSFGASLPAGLTIEPTRGTIQGVPRAPTEHASLVQVKNRHGIDYVQMQITVFAAPPPSAELSEQGQVGVGIHQQPRCEPGSGANEAAGGDAEADSGADSDRAWARWRLSEALRLYRLAAVQGDAEAIRKEGECHYNEPPSWAAVCPRDLGLAAEHFQRAANKGDSTALYQLGRMHEGGEGPFVANASKAIELYDECARRAPKRRAWPCYLASTALQTKRAFFTAFGQAKAALGSLPF